MNEQEKNVDQKEKIKEYGLTISDLEATNNKLKKRAIKCSDDLLENLSISNQVLCKSKRIGYDYSNTNFTYSGNTTINGELKKVYRKES